MHKAVCNVVHHLYASFGTLSLSLSLSAAGEAGKSEPRSLSQSSPTQSRDYRPVGLADCSTAQDCTANIAAVLYVCLAIMIFAMMINCRRLHLAGRTNPFRW